MFMSTPIVRWYKTIKIEGFKKQSIKKSDWNFLFQSLMVPKIAVLYKNNFNTIYKSIKNTAGLIPWVLYPDRTITVWQEGQIKISHIQECDTWHFTCMIHGNVLQVVSFTFGNFHYNHFWQIKLPLQGNKITKWRRALFAHCCIKFEIL